MSNGWIEEGVSTRTMFGHPNPIVHLVVVERNELWCSGGPGRVASIGAQRGTGGGRPCRKCAALAHDAVVEGDAEASDFSRFLPETVT